MKDKARQWAPEQRAALSKTMRKVKAKRPYKPRAEAWAPNQQDALLEGKSARDLVAELETMAARSKAITRALFDKFGF